jgi:SET domain-containing protein
MSLIYRSPKIDVKESPIQGRGIFAKENISKGEIISIQTGHIIQENELDHIEKTVGGYWFQIRDHFYLSPLTPEEASETALYINHSCDPNTGVDGDIGLVAIRDIERNEEICYDYGMDTSDPNYSFSCNCGSDRCRKTVTGNDWKNPDLQKRYGYHFAWYILKKIHGWE